MADINELDQRLSKIEEQVAENNKMLRSIYRHQWLSNLMRLLYWLVLLGAAGAIYYFLKPVYEQLLSVYSNLGNQLDGVKNLLDIIP